MRLIIKVIVGLWVCLALWNCSGKAAKGNTASLPDTLRVGTLYSPTCFFLFRGDTLGYEYERILNLSQKKGFEVKFSVAPNLNSLLAMLDSGIIDIIACEVPVTDEYKRRVLSCGTENVTTQVLVQMKSDSMITDVTQLVGKKVWVEKDSKYDSRLRNLDNELGGGIDIKTISSDTLGIEDLIDLVANGKIPYTLVDSDIARLNQTYYSSLDVNLQVSFPQRAAWAVALSNRQLADSINAWSESDAISSANKAVLKRYFEISRNNLEIQGPAPFMLDAKHGVISRYDEFFKIHGKASGIDWRLLASYAWNESQFGETRVSWAGARGMMQLMPKTAAHYGVYGNDIDDPNKNIMAASMLLKELDRMFAKYVSDSMERRKFVAAAYNSGYGHVFDAIALAKKHGLNPEHWEANVETAILWKSKPEYFNDEVCRNGYFRGTETVSFVQKIMSTYHVYSSKTNK